MKSNNTTGQYTAAPWTVMLKEELTGRARLHIIGGEDGDLPIATLKNGFVNDKANSFLISASPEMFEALQLLISEAQESCAQEGMGVSFDKPQECFSPGINAAIKAVIKAKGGSR